MSTGYIKRANGREYKVNECELVQIYPVPMAYDFMQSKQNSAARPVLTTNVLQCTFRLLFLLEAHVQLIIILLVDHVHSSQYI